MSLNGIQSRQVLALWNHGCSMREIANRMGVSIWQVSPLLPDVPDIMLAAALHVADVERKAGKHPAGPHPSGKVCPWMMVLEGQLTLGSVTAYQ